MMQLLVRSDCCLVGAPIPVQKALEHALTMENPRYEEALRYGRWIGKNLKPKLFFFRRKGDGLHFPRGFGNEAVRLCRQFAGESPELAYTGYIETEDASLGEGGMFMNTEYDTIEVLNRLFPGRAEQHYHLFSPLLSALILVEAD